ncbi:hypothetical protein FQR65_LT14098 [Abscondita terminalis]|nr:hypothetical protein FQR65_LT14098 [Abscondita terminalis]
MGGECRSNRASTSSGRGRRSKEPYPIPKLNQLKDIPEKRVTMRPNFSLIAKVPQLVEQLKRNNNNKHPARIIVDVCAVNTIRAPTRPRGAVQREQQQVLSSRPGISRDGSGTEGAVRRMSVGAKARGGEVAAQPLALHSGLPLPVRVGRPKTLDQPPRRGLI